MKIQHLFLFLITVLVSSCQSTPKYVSFDDYPVYEGSDLELTYTPQSSAFRIWAPTATNAKLLLYVDGYEGGAYQTLDMERSDEGTWTLEVKENLKGKFYTFQIKINDKWMNETPGMWVKATGVNGKRAAIIDFAETNPDGWENDKRPIIENFSDIMLYEVHLRDFSVSPNSGIKNKGKFLAFTERGTKNTAGDATGIDHLKDLGITHVQLMPSSDFASVDETRLHENKYDWGYAPVNFNVPEGSYSTNPYDPKIRIREFKQMVQSLHQSGIAVVMEMVFNHTAASKDSYFNQLVPGYFYRMNADSVWSNATDYGNEIASERAMMRKFMIESVVFWATEYHIDGFCFDLMGVHDIVTMNEIRAALDKIDPSIIMYGDGFLDAPSPLAQEKRALNKNAKLLGNIALYNHDLSDALIGNWINAEIPGFVSGVDSLEENLKFGIVGSTKHSQLNNQKLINSKNAYVNNPTQIINFASKHNNMCLVDKLLQSKPADATDEELVRFNKLAQTVIFTSQGIPFIYGGEEVYRNKKGLNNSFQSPDSINSINWDFKTTHKDVFDYYKGLIALRKAHAAFRIPTQEMLQNHLKFVDLLTPNVVAFTLSDHVNGEIWKDVLVIYNANRKHVSVQIPPAEWNLVCHDGVINLSTISVVNTTNFTLAPSSASILYVK